MAFNVPDFLRRDGDSLLYNGKGEMYIYVPESYFDANYAEELGEIISLLGIADFSINNNPDKPIYGKDTHNLYFPSVFLTTPYETIEIKDLSLGDVESRDYRILKYKNGDKVVNSVYIPKLSTNMEIFFQATTITKNSPSTIKYGSFWKYYTKNAELCGGNYKINAAAFGLIESELCRDPNDLFKPYRLSSSYKKGGTNYTKLGIKDVPRYISTYTAVTSENWDESIIAATMNDKEVYSPLESILMG